MRHLIAGLVVGGVLGGGVAAYATSGDPLSFSADCEAPNGVTPGAVITCTVDDVVTVPTTTPPPTTTAAAPTTTRAPTTTVAPTTTIPAGGQLFVANFATRADFSDRFDTHVGNACTLDQTCRPENIDDSVKQFSGSHNVPCAAPPSTRTVSISNHANLFWWCAPGGPSSGHVMTGLNTSGYSLVSFSPRQVFTDVSRICWDQSLADLGGGKWSNVVIVPEAVVVAHPNPNPRRAQEGEGPHRLDYVTPGFDELNGPGGFNLIDIDEVFGVKQFRGTLGIYDGRDFIATWDESWTAGTDESTRFKHCFIDNGNGTVTIEQQRGDGVYSRTTAGAFPNGRVRVIFQDDTYDADKHGGTGRYTWHWDNIEIR